jgi:Mg-chelatase subunit ChlI
MKITFIGGGNMAVALIGGLKKKGFSAAGIQVVEPNAEARERLPNVQHSGRDLATIANLMAQMGVDGHRADLVILRAARAHAAFQKRESITENDILLAAELALPHRLKRHPFQDTEQAMSVLSDKLQQIESQMEQQQAQDQQSQQGKQQDASKKVKRG